jgi:hypothetical protein
VKSRFFRLFSLENYRILNCVYGIIFLLQRWIDLNLLSYIFHLLKQIRCYRLQFTKIVNIFHFGVKPIFLGEFKNYFSDFFHFYRIWFPWCQNCSAKISGHFCNESGRFGALKSDSTHHFFRNACSKSGSLRFSQFSGCWLILSVYIIMSFD